MFILRTIMPGSDPQKPVNMRDTEFATKREMFEVINRTKISNIRKLPGKTKVYAITVSK